MRGPLDVIRACSMWPGPQAKDQGPQAQFTAMLANAFVACLLQFGGEIMVFNEMRQLHPGACC